MVRISEESIVLSTTMMREFWRRLFCRKKFFTVARTAA